MKTGVNTSIIIDINKERERKNIKPLKCNCKTCLYFNGKICRFNKNTENRKYCIKYEYSKPSLIKKPKKDKRPKKDNIKQEIVIKKTTFKNLSKFFGVPIKRETLQMKYKNYSNGYGMRIKTEEPLVIVLRNNRGKKSHYEIIE